MRRFSRGLMLALCIAFTLPMVGCYGSFTLTKKVHTWNAEVHENKWVDELVFLGLNFIPVYGLATFADAIIFNSIEFWTGDNPMAGDMSGNLSVIGNEDFVTIKDADGDLPQQ